MKKIYRVNKYIQANDIREEKMFSSYRKAYFYILEKIEKVELVKCFNNEYWKGHWKYQEYEHFTPYEWYHHIYKLNKQYKHVAINGEYEIEIIEIN